MKPISNIPPESLVALGHKAAATIEAEYPLESDVMREIATRFDVLREIHQLTSDLAPENAGMKDFIDGRCWVYDDSEGRYLDAVNYLPETPATDAFTRELMARGVEALADAYDERAKEAAHYMTINRCRTKADQARDFASELRKGINDAQ